MAAARQLVDPYIEYNEPVIKNLKPSRKPKKRRVPATVKVCCIAALCVALSLLYLQQQVSFYYLNMELAQLQEQVNILEQRNDHLMLNLESQRSLQKIEQLARKELGMVEPERVTSLVLEPASSIPTNQGGRWIDNSPERVPSQGVFATLAGWFNKAFPLGGVEAGTLRRK